MIEKKALVDGKEYTFRSSALIPRMYREKFGRDMIKDMSSLAKAYKETKGDEDKMLGFVDLTIFENVAWLMMHYAGEDVLESPEQWLDSLDGPFSVYEALPVIIDLWNINNKTTSKPRKK